MGVIRGILLIFVASLFFLAVFLSFLTFTLASSLKYDNVKVEMTSLIKNIAENQLGLNEKINQLLPVMKRYCNTSSEYVFNYSNYTIVFPCETILQGGNAIIDYGSGEIVKQIYYKDYQCSFFDCFSKQQGLPLFLISESTRIFLISKFYLLLVASIVLIILMFLLVEKKSNAGILAGISVIFAALPLKLLSGIIPNLSKSLGDFSGIFNVFFSGADFVFLRGIILGGLILAIGLIFKIFGIEMKIYNFISKSRKEPVKEIIKEKTKAKIKGK